MNPTFVGGGQVSRRWRTLAVVGWLIHGCAAPPTPPVELDCDDGQDGRDFDGLADCFDSDCADATPCVEGWPRSLLSFERVQIDFEPDAEGAEREFAACTVQAALELQRRYYARFGNADQVWCGDFVIQESDCHGALDLPVNLCLGFSFDEVDTAWTTWRDGRREGASELLASATSGDGTIFHLHWTEPASADGHPVGALRWQTRFLVDP